MRPPPSTLQLHEVDSERFWSCVEIAGERDCWPWACGRTGTGYGTFYVLGRAVGSHRVAWALHHGRTPAAGEVVKLLCDNPPCCNPRHLALSSRAETNRAVAQRRQAGSFSSVTLARALLDGATADDLVRIFALPEATAREYVALGPAGVVGRRAARGVRIPQRHTRRRQVANPAALAAARAGVSREELEHVHGLSRATAYRYLARAGETA